MYLEVVVFTIVSGLLMFFDKRIETKEDTVRLFVMWSIIYYCISPFITKLLNL